MTTISAIPQKRKQKHIKRKNRSRHHRQSVISQIPLSKEHQPMHELLSDWSDAT